MDGVSTIIERPDLRAQFTDGLSPLPPVRRRPWLARKLWSHRWFALFVVLPTLIVSGYFFGYAADQFESEAKFTVRSNSHAGGSNVSGLGQMLGMGGGGSLMTGDAYSVNDYLDSHDAVGALRKKVDLVNVFRRPEADELAKLWWPDPTAEGLLRYFRRHFTIAFNSETGITQIRVQAFRPDDAKRLVELMLELGEARVNELNKRLVADTVRVASDEVTRAEERVAESQKNLTEFRVRQQDINPERSSVAQLNLVGLLQGQLAQSRAQLSSMGAAIRADSPQYIALSNRIRAIEGQVATESAKLTGANNAMAPVLSQYEQLTLRQEFAQKTYTAAAGSLEAAKQQAIKQQLFVVRVVEPNLAEKALYPRSYTIVGTILATLLLAYYIGWMIIAGVREHAV